MVGKKISVVVILFSMNALCGEHTLSGNIRLDILSLNTYKENTNRIFFQQEQVKEKQNGFMNGLYSLVLPGAGQFRSERYTKAAIFLGVEIALATFAIISNNRGDKKTDEFQQYAEQHWSALRYAKWINVYGTADYGPAATIDLNRVAQNDFSEINAWERSFHNVRNIGFSHTLPEYQAQQYYELIGKYHQFKFGWSSYPDLNNDGIPDSDGGNYDDFIPQQLKDYAVERGKANDYYYAASFAVSVLVVNHVLSGLDALFSTADYNRDISASLQLTPVDGLEGKRLLSEVRLSIGF